MIDAELEEIDEELEEKLNYLHDTYTPIYKPEEKERNIMIWHLHHLGFNDKQISDVSGKAKSTIRDIYVKLEKSF